MGWILRAGVVVGALSWAGIAGAATKQAVSLDDLFAAVDKAKPTKGSKANKASPKVASVSRSASSVKSSSVKSKVVKGEGRAAKIKAPQRAAPAPVEAPAADAHGGAATPEQVGLVLVEYAPERHALAGP
jgi:hypothetical protein